MDYSYVPLALVLAECGVSVTMLSQLLALVAAELQILTTLNTMLPEDYLNNSRPEPDDDSLSDFSEVHPFIHRACQLG